MPDIKYSRHAPQRMTLRGISEKEVKEAIRRGRKRKERETLVATYVYLEVVYKITDGDIYVITVKHRW